MDSDGQQTLFGGHGAVPASAIVMPPTPGLLFLDIEASSLLPGGHPIELAWVNQDGEGESYLVRPEPTWTLWSKESERVHGISCQTLAAEGIPAADVARRAMEILGVQDMLVCSDAPGFDGRWLATLLAAGDGGRTVEVVDVARAYERACRPLAGTVPDEWQRDRLERKFVERAKAGEAARPGMRHRALADAGRLWRTWRAVENQVSEYVGLKRNAYRLLG